MMMINSGRFPTPPFVVDAAEFGVGDSAARGAALTGVIDSKSGVFACCVQLSGADGGERQLLQSSSDKFDFWRTFTQSRWALQLRKADGTIICSLRSSIGSAASRSAFYRILASWDMATGAAQFYIDDVSNNDEPGVLSNDLAALAGETDWVVSSLANSTCFAEMYFAPGQYLDFSIEANRRKFFSADGKPIALGTDGSIPTGIAPAVFFHLDDGEAVANFAINRGTGGGPWAITGALATCPTSPTD